MDKNLNEMLNGIEYYIRKHKLFVISPIPKGREISWDGYLSISSNIESSVKIHGCKGIIISGDTGEKFEYNGNAHIVINGNLGALSQIETMGGVTIYKNVGKGCYIYTDNAKLSIIGRVDRDCNLFGREIETGPRAENVRVQVNGDRPPLKPAEYNL